MKNFLDLIRKIQSKVSLENVEIEHGPKGIQQVGHRQYVGGLWEEIGKLQFDFLVENGLKPSDVLLDIACGSLRAGIHFIPYLQQGHYLGIDKESSLIELGLRNELGEELLASQKPEFVISDCFEFNKFSKEANFAIAQSLFTHLPPKMIIKCLLNLKPNFARNGVFYASYFITEKPVNNPVKAHDHGFFRYTLEEIHLFGSKTGWKTEIIGDWCHPRNQMIVKYSAQDS